MSIFTLTNNFSTTLAAAATTSATSLTVTSTTNLPTSITSGNYFPVVLLDEATKSVYEICYATAVSGSTLTVVRAQEGTTAQSWSIGDYIYCAPTAGTLTTGFANLNGNSSNKFQAANGTAGNDVINFSQLPSLLFSTITDQTSSRSFNSIYTNSTGNLMFVEVSIVNNQVAANITGNIKVNGNDVGYYQWGSTTGGHYLTDSARLVAMVAPGSTYEVTNSGGGTLYQFVEYT